MNKNIQCQRIKKWILSNPGKKFPFFIDRHLHTCSDCRFFIEEENWIKSLIQDSLSTIPEIPNEQSLKVKQTIWEVSQKISTKKKKAIFLFPKVAFSFTVLSMLVLFFFAPLFQGETFFGFKMNQKFYSFLNHNETIDFIFSKKEESLKGLNFVSRYVESPEEKTFYYGSSSLSKEEYLFVKYLSNKTKTSADQIYTWLKEKSYAYVLRKLNLPYQKTWNEVKSYINQFRESPNNPSFKLDGYILAVNYLKSEILIDSYPDEIQIDLFTINRVYVGMYANFSLKKLVTGTTCINYIKSDFPTTVITGKVESQNDCFIKLVGNPTNIQITSRTIIQTYNGTRINQKAENQILRIRALSSDNTLTAITITPEETGTERTLTGYLDRGYDFGFTLKGLQISFCFLEKPVIKPSNLPAGTLLTVAGTDKGSYFIVKKCVKITKRYKIYSCRGPI